MARDLSKVLAALTAQQVAQLMERYYSGESTAALIKQYSLSVSTSQLYKAFPPEVLDAPCSMCGGLVSRPRPSRSGKPPLASCGDCGHDGSARCACEVCVEQRRQLRQAEEDKNRSALLSSYANWRADPPSYFDVPFEQRVYLGALLAGHGGQSTQIISPLDAFPIPFSARWDFVDPILAALRSSRSMVIYPTDDLSPFVFPPGESWRFYPGRVHYQLNLQEPDAAAWLLHPDPVAPLDQDAARSLWRTIAAEEVREYLDTLMRERGISLAFGEKTLDAIDHMVANFSVAEAYYFCYLTAKNTSDDIQARKKTRKHAANTVPFRLSGYVDKAVAGGWDVSHYSRDRRCPRTLLAAFFYDSVVKVGHRGFNMKASDWYPEPELDDDPPENVVPFTR